MGCILYSETTGYSTDNKVGVWRAAAAHARARAPRPTRVGPRRSRRWGTDSDEADRAPFSSKMFWTMLVVYGSAAEGFTTSPTRASVAPEPVFPCACRPPPLPVSLLDRLASVASTHLVKRTHESLQGNGRPRGHDSTPSVPTRPVRSVRRLWPI